MPDYNYYTSIYHGTLESAVFNRLIVKASSYLAAVTLGKSNREDLPAPVKDAVCITLCSLVDEMYHAEKGGDIASESNDGISVTFAGRKQQTDAEKFASVISDHLAWTGLLYRGCCFAVCK